MADKKVILELDIDVESIIAKSVNLKASLDSMRAEMAKLKASGDTSSEAFVKLDAALKQTTSEYNLNQKQLQNLSAGQLQFLSIQDKMTAGLNKEITSIASARANNTELLKIRNELNLKTADGAKAAEQINAKLDANNKFIKENVSAYEKQKIGIGDYKTAISEALKESNLFGGEMQRVTQVFNNFSPVFNTLKQELTQTWQQRRLNSQATSSSVEIKWALAPSAAIAARVAASLSARLVDA